MRKAQSHERFGEERLVDHLPESLGGATLLGNRAAISGFSRLTAMAQASEQGRRTIR